MRKSLVFSKILSLALCFVMISSILVLCFKVADSSGANPDFGQNAGVPDSNPTLPIVPSNPGDNEDEKEPEENKDPDEIFAATTVLASNALIYGTLASDVVIGEADGVGATIPADVRIEAGASSLALSVKNTETGSEITLGEGETAKSLDVHISGIAADNTVPMIVNLGAVLATDLGATELKFYHIENGAPIFMTRVDSASEFAIHNQYTYNSKTGEVSIYVASFSVFSAVQTTVSVWDGEAADTEWYNEAEDSFTIENAAQFVGFRNLVDAGNTFAGKTVTLGIDIDLADIPFDPIGFGYWNESKVDAESGVDSNTVFMGTFDGAGHTVYNLYENCWELDPDKTNYSTYTYSTAGAGLFASIKNATIKNLAVSGAEIVFECVDMGIIVGYAQGTCHFENIVVTDSNIANYNRYTGGVVGEVSYGPYGIDTSLGYSHTFKNVTVDSTVKVSGLWGSFGCGMGGVIGGKWGDATVKMENVISAAEMDVYNDVVSAYQWYAFRGCGMLIGHTEEPYSDGRHSGNATASFLTCENVKVYYGDWVNYNYYEFENQDNGTGQRYPWVRAEAGEYCDAFSNIRYGVPTHNGVKVSDLTEEELKAVATDYTPIVFDQLYGADRGMYGTAAHEGVTVYNKLTKTIYIQNNLGWENLKLYYWYVNGQDKWGTIIDGISMDSMLVETQDGYGIYMVELPIYAEGFKISATDNEGNEILVSDVIEGQTYTLEGEHIHTLKVSSTVLPTCTEQGYTIYVCDVCGHSDTDYVEKIPHSFGGNLEGEDGFYHECESCGYIENIKAPVADSYKATINNTFTSDSDKDNTIKFTFTKNGEAGIYTNGTLSNEYTNGIGGLDKGVHYIGYEFYMEKAGTVDIIWEIAGNYWKSGVGNAGLDDMANYMAITIDGKTVDIRGLALPKGDGTTTHEYWNIQKFVLEGIVLDAGVHTLYCNIDPNDNTNDSTTSGGLNVGTMTIKSTKPVTITPTPEVTSARVELEGDKVYYVLTLENCVYNKDEITFFNDGNNIIDIASLVKNDDGTIDIKMDITNFDVNTTIYPHLMFGKFGIKYVNGINTLGDVRGTTIDYSEGQYETASNKHFVLYNYYDMPTIRICGSSNQIMLNIAYRLLQVGDKPILRLTYICLGWGENPTVKFFDNDHPNKELDCVVKISGALAICDIDLTKTLGQNFYMHMSINGSKWNGKNNGSSNDGNVFVPDYTGTSNDNWHTYDEITVGGNKYVLGRLWSMFVIGH